MAEVQQTDWGYRHASVKGRTGAVDLSESPAPGGLLLIVGALFPLVGRPEAAELARLLSHYASTGRLPGPGEGTS